MNTASVTATALFKRARVEGARGFTLIELMIAIAIVAILAAIALPAYLDYTTRAKVSEGLVILDGMKLRVEEVYYVEGWVGDTLLGVVIPDKDQLGRYINTAQYYLGGSSSANPTRLAVTYNASVPPVTKRCLGLTASLDGGSNAASLKIYNGIPADRDKITWVCRTTLTTNGNIATKYLPTTCRGTDMRPGTDNCVD